MNELLIFLIAVLVLLNLYLLIKVSSLKNELSLLKKSYEIRFNGVEERILKNIKFASDCAVDAHKYSIQFTKDVFEAFL